MTYDVVFHNDVNQYLYQPEFKKFVADSAIDGINRVMQENKEKVSSDYKIMKHMNCKGVRPQMMAIQKQSDNPLLQNMDSTQQKTKLQRDIEAQKDGYLDAQAKEEADKIKALEDEKKGDEEDDDEEKEEPRPDGIVPPKHKIVHSYPVDLQDAWEGHKDSIEGH